MRFFVSYSRTDRLFVDLLVPMLTQVYGPGSVWFDEQIPGGVDWWRLILEQVAECDVFLFLISNDSLASSYCQEECREAVHLGKPILPIVVRPKTDIWKHVPNDLEPLLRRINYIDLSSGFKDTRSITTLYGSLNTLITGLPVHPAPTRSASVAIPILPDQPNNPNSGYSPIEWCPVTSGEVNIVDASQSNPPGSVGGCQFVSAFEIAKYPITNALFDDFITASDGYSQRDWWDYSPTAARWHLENPEPRETAFKGSNLPRTNVCWYEALAYCAWLSVKFGRVVTLPTEEQWQRAAQGDDNRLYPWGNVFEPQRCNARSKGVTSIDQFPEGASPFGVLDMTGNVLEWCLTNWRDGSASVLKGSQRVLRGGSWHKVSTEQLQVTYRVWNYPDFRADNRGFRVVLLP